MLRQYMNGKLVQTVMVSGSTGDLEALADVLEGGIKIYDLKASGGNMNTTIPVLNSVGFSVGKKYPDGSRSSAFVRLPHLKPTKSIADVKTAVLGVWDASTFVTEKCEYVNEIGNSSRG